MVWEIRTWVEDGRDDHVVHVRARCRALREVDDVSLDCGGGVHALDPQTSVRRGMSGFSRPIEGTFWWDAETERPEVVIRWSDMGEPSQQHIPLVPLAPSLRHPGRPALRRLLRSRS